MEIIRYKPVDVSRASLKAIYAYAHMYSLDTKIIGHKVYIMVPEDWQDYFFTGDDR